ncbi:MAG: fatty acid desaturase [Rhizobiales bacterium]|nr:fatty acid desaturase [Hyphomicrobiales bacterium]
MKNLRFAISPLLLVITIGTFFIGGYWLWAGFLFVTLLPRLGDLIFGDEAETHGTGPKWLMEIFHFSIMPLMAILSLLLLYYVGGASMSWLEILARWIGADIANARSHTGFGGLLGGVLTLAIFQGSAGVIVGHEFMHRATNPVFRWLGLWMIAPTGFVAISLEHVKGHHLNVGIPGDPETAIRGIGFWRFMVENIVATNRDAVVREQGRLHRAGIHWLSFGNRLFHGFALSFLIAGLFVLAAGWAGLLVFAAIAGIGSICITLFSYIAHYGLVRVPGTRIEARHSWNSYKFWSSSSMFNLMRHADHHLHSSRPYWKLESRAGCPVFPYGATIMAGLALFPPLWHKVVAAPLADWDADLATNSELRLLRQVEIIRNACVEAPDLQGIGNKTN